MSATRRIARWMMQWGPVLILMALIFFASSLPKLPPAEPTDRLYFSGLMPVFPPPWEVIIKKGGHLVGYALLALLILRALRIQRLALRRALAGAWLVVAVYATSDEIHQSFVAGRGASARDVVLDVIGATLALLAARWFIRRRMRRPRDRAQASESTTRTTPGQSHSHAPR